MQSIRNMRLMLCIFLLATTVLASPRAERDAEFPIDKSPDAALEDQEPEQKDDMFDLTQEELKVGFPLLSHYVQMIHS